MYVAPTSETEIRHTIEATLDFVNGLLDDDVDLRQLLTDAGFSGAHEASEASLSRADLSLRDLQAFFVGLPDDDIDSAAARISTELAALPIQPSIVDHDGAGHHIHWTAASARFDDKVLADILMAFAQEICDNGTIRFGTCAADDCDHLFYDGTRNRSRRFCSDPRCASRTHTAHHRARRRTSRSTPPLPE